MPKSWSFIPSLIKGTKKGPGRMTDSKTGSGSKSIEHFIVLESKEKKAKIPQWWDYAKGVQELQIAKAEIIWATK